jgi:hypothetical protein
MVDFGKHLPQEIHLLAGAVTDTRGGLSFGGMTDKAHGVTPFSWIGGGSSNHPERKPASPSESNWHLAQTGNQAGASQSPTHLPAKAQ